MQFENWPSWCLLIILATLSQSRGADDDYNIVNRDGSFQFGYETPDSYHHADANRNNVVRGEFGGRNPATGGIDSTIYTAGPRGFRPRGKNVHRKYDLSQNGPRPIGSRDDPYYDPFEDPSYNFAFRTRTYSRQENANRVGDVNGKYSYVDDVGERHNVEFIAGKNTGFHVKTPYPDSNPRAYGPLYFRGRGKPIPRGRTSIQRGLDGSYRFVSAGPDQRRTETSDSTGHVRGSYTYLDDKGVQHSVHYIAGPETGYKVLKNVKGPHLPTVFPFGRPDIIPPDFYDYDVNTGDVFDTAASGHVKPPSPSSKPGAPTFDSGIDVGQDDLNQLDTDLGKPTGNGNKPSSGRPSRPRPTYDGGDDDLSDDFGDDLFGVGGGGAGSSSTVAPPRPSRPPSSGSGTDDDGSYKPSPSPPSNNGAYIPPGDPNQDDGQYRPGADESGLGGERPRPGLGSRPTPARPSYQDDYDYNNDLSLFGSETNSRPPSRPRPPVIQVQGGGSDNNGAGCEKCRGTIVTNVGDRLFTVPPGVSVRAHVQSIDLLPLFAKVPSPSEQFKEDMNIKTEQLNSAASDVVHNNGTVTDNDTTTATSETVTTTTATAASASTTTATSITTTTIAPSTTVAATATTEDENEDDVSIF